MGGPGGFELTQTADDPRSGDEPVLQTAAGKLENGRWYHVRLRVEGARLQVKAGRQGAVRSRRYGRSRRMEQAFVGVRGGGANFAHLSVKRADGAQLLASVPHAGAALVRERCGRNRIGYESSAERRAESADGGAVRRFGCRTGGLRRARRGRLARIAVAFGDGPGPGGAPDGWRQGPGGAEGGRCLGNEWKEFPLLLNPTANSGNATLRILARAGSDVKLDQVSLMPDSSRANGGFRPDLTRAAAALASVRDPLAGRQFGRRTMMEGRHRPAGEARGQEGWDEWDPLAFGIDEFLAFARKVGAEPVIVDRGGQRRGPRAVSCRTRSIWWHTAMARATARGAKSARRTGIPNRIASSTGKSVSGLGRIPPRTMSTC